MGKDGRKIGRVDSIARRKDQEGRGLGEGCEIEFSYVNSYDHTHQQAAGFVSNVPGARPLIVVAHFAGGTRFTARELGYYTECARRGWHCVCPQLHGAHMFERGAFGSLESQYDILDAVKYMVSHYVVDSSRVYLSGRSMGGMIALLVAAKYPDTFAAVVAGQPITDLVHWHLSSSQYRLFIEEIACGRPYSEENAFEYVRRSPIEFGPNFRYIPVILWHGTADTVVDPGESKRLQAVIAKWTGRQVPVKWIAGGEHDGCGPTIRWICGQLARYPRRGSLRDRSSRCIPRIVEVCTDEDKPFFWLGIERRNAQAMGYVRVELVGDVAHVRDAENIQRLILYADRVPASVHPQWSRQSVDGITCEVVNRMLEYP